MRLLPANVSPVPISILEVEGSAKLRYGAFDGADRWEIPVLMVAKIPWPLAQCAPIITLSQLRGGRVRPSADGWTDKDVGDLRVEKIFCWDGRRNPRTPTGAPVSTSGSVVPGNGETFLLGTCNPRIEDDLQICDLASSTGFVRRQAE